MENLLFCLQFWFLDWFLGRYVPENENPISWIEFRFKPNPSLLSSGLVIFCHCINMTLYVPSSSNYRWYQMSGHDGLTDDRRADGFAKGILFARDPRPVYASWIWCSSASSARFSLWETLKLGSFKLTIRRERER